MPDLDAFYLRAARDFYNRGSDDEKREIGQIVYGIRANPYVDNVIKFAFPFPPAEPVLYADGRFYVVYDYENNWTLAIWDIGYDDESLLVPKPPDHR